MSSAKDQLDDMADERRDRSLAKALGLTYDELVQTDFEISEDEGEGSNEGIVYATLVRFSSSSPQSILKKIKGLDSMNTVRLDSFEWNPGSEED